ncbi:MAG: MFS transporter [Nitrososphaerales archaeon]|nr:MFS transporter [Nitrososphaerales archaeon]
MQKRFLLYLLGFAHSLNHSLFLALPPLVPLMITQMGVSIKIISTFATIGYFIYGFGSIVGGILTNRLGELKVLILCITLSGVSTIIICLSPNLLGFASGFLIMSIWASFYHPTAYSLISKVYKLNLGAAFGMHGAIGNVGQIFTPTISAFIGLYYGWQYSFLTFGILTIMAAIPLYKFHIEGLKEGEMDMDTFLNLFKRSTFWKLYAFNIFNGSVFRSVEFILPTFLVIVKSLKVEVAGYAMSIMLVAGILGQLIGGRLADKFGSYKMLIAESLGIAISLILLIFIPSPIMGIALFVIIYGISMYASYPSFNYLAAFVSEPQIRGALYGFLFFMTFGCGSLSVFLTGLISHEYGADVAIMVLIVIAILALIVSIFLPKARKVESN